jgi:pimeloyl-ACP methyl ester carboxylesterase
MLRYILAGGATSALLLLVACGSSTGTDGNGGGTATLSGTVREAQSGATIADAKVTAGSRTATSDATGQFQLTGLATGAANVQVKRPGYELAEASVTIAAGANSHDFTMSPQEVYVLGATAVFVPAGVGPMRGTIIALGGPLTNGFVTGGQIETGNAPLAEALLQALGASLRELARTQRVALLGNAGTPPNSAGSDNDFFASLGSAALLSGHAEITNAPVLILGLGEGGTEASGLAARHPERAVGLLAWLPPGVASLTSSAALAVPTFVMQAALDGSVDNAGVRTTFAANRSQGGLWALAVEPNVSHQPTATGNATVITWMGEVIDRRLPATAGQPLVTLDEASGWLGNQTTLEIAPWADYQGSRTMASWFLSQSHANAWKSFGQN